MPKACGETQLEIIHENASMSGKKFFQNCMFTNDDNKHIRKYFGDKLPIDTITDSRIDPLDLDEEELELTNLNLDDIIKIILDEMDTNGYVAIDLAMGGDCSDFYHCFAISKVQMGNYLLTHTYLGEIDDKVTVPFSLIKFRELLETGKKEIWTEIFNVDELESGSPSWKIIITRIL